MWKKIVKAVVLFVSLVALAVWLEQATREARESVQSIPSHYLWWGLGIAATVALLAWLFKDAERRRQTAGVYKSRWFLWPVVILLFVAGGIWVWEQYGDLGRDRPTLMVSREWSPYIRVLPGKQVLWQRRENVAYEIMTQTGNIYPFARDPEKDTRTACKRHVWISEATSSFRIRVTDPEIEKVGFDITFSPWTKDGPCGSVTPPQTPPSTPPPDGDRYI